MKLILLGMQWGDEGKGKLVDLLTDFSDIVIRFQGGSNAGHTLIHNDEKIVLHIVPSGILHDNVISVISNGVVVDLEELDLEIDKLKEHGIIINSDKLKISLNCHLLFPYHELIDKYREENSKNKIGTTRKGIGPAYEDKIARRGIRFQDFLDKELFDSLIEKNIEYYNFILRKLYKKETLDLDQFKNKYDELRLKLKDFAQDTAFMLDNANNNGSKLLFEGAQGALLDLDHGTYPYVTSCNTTVGAVFSGSGLGTDDSISTLGVFKSYTSRMGKGPFPTEIHGEIAEKLVEYGNEKSIEQNVETKRRIGYLDLVAIKHSIRINNIKSLAITKLDVLSHFDEIKICIKYNHNGNAVSGYINNERFLNEVECVYETIPGWKSNIDDIRSFDELPENAKKYINAIETILEMPIDIISVGNKKNATILRNNPFRR